MREALAEALSDFPGAIVLVSHDRHLIGLVCDTFWRVAAGSVQKFSGDLDEYAAWLRSRPAEDASPDRDRQDATTGSASAASRKSYKANPQRVMRAERRVADLQARLDATETQLADPALYVNDVAQAAALDARHRGLRAELERAEAELLELYAADAA